MDEQKEQRIPQQWTQAVLLVTCEQLLFPLCFTLGF